MKEGAQLTDAVWAALAERIGGAWIFRAAHHLSKSAQAELARLLERPAVDAWLCGALTGGHSRSGALPAGARLGPQRLFAFPVAGSSRVILVGAAQQNASAQRLWRLAASLLVASDPAGGVALPDLQAGLTDDLSISLDRLLASFVRAVSPQGAWIGILRGESLVIHSEWNDPQSRGVALEVDAHPILRRMRRSRSELALIPGQPEWAERPLAADKAGSQVWACIPLVLGNRMIGAVALWRQSPFGPEEWGTMHDLAERLAPVAEVNVTFAEMAGHLRRLAMLNDFVLTVSSAQNLDQVAQRAFALLARVFGTELLSLLLVSPDFRYFREFHTRSGTLRSESVSSPDPAIQSALHDGRLQRLGDSAKSAIPPIHPGARSALHVPLKHRGQAIGLISIEHVSPDAFSQFDEHLMVVIAGHLAALIEYGRLREEAEGRARNLGLIHEVVQAIIGLNDKAEVAQIAADLLAQYFRYELAVVLLKDGDEDELIHGFGGARGQQVERILAGAAFANPHGVTGRVFDSGQSILVNDTLEEPSYVALEGWDAGSEMCVALKDGGRIVGIIDVESAQKNAFSQNDLAAMESLAGILATVVSSADHHQRMRETVTKLRGTEAELKTQMDALRSAEKQLVQSAKLAAVGEMAAGIAHELNNPLTTVTGFAELLLEETPADSPSRGELELVLREARRAGDVVRRLLDFSRQGERARVASDFNEIVADVIALTNHLIRSSGVTLSLQLDQELPRVAVDRNQMKQVILNLIHNSLQAMPAGGTLEIGTARRNREQRSWMVCWVRDNGMGISMEAQEKIFEPFFTTKGDQGGTGLGLSVTYGIVADHAGTIEVESKLGSGTTFDVWLPV